MRRNLLSVAVLLARSTTLLLTFIGTAVSVEVNQDGSAKENLYLAPKGLSPDELIEFIFKMQDKPLSIQKRDGFSAAIIDAADRVMASDAKGPIRRIATLTKIETLHKEAFAGNDMADEQLQKFIEQLKDSEDEQVKKEVVFLRLERKAINSDDLSLEEIPDLLNELNDFFANEKLGEKHLRIASNTVRTINRLDSKDKQAKEQFGEMRESYFAEFGNLFAKSDNRQLSAYGKKLAKSLDSGASELVGKPLELAGETVAGAKFDWETYRDSVVIVDFWATWCGPCLREMPDLKAFYEKNKDRGLKVVGVSVDKDLAALDKFMERHEIAWETLAGEQVQALAKKQGVQTLPTLMLVNQQGKVVAVSNRIGKLSVQAEKLLAQRPAE